MKQSDHNNKFLQFQKELKEYIPALSEAAQIMVDQDVTEYPIFIVHQQQFDAGIPIIEKEKVSGNWSVNASSLEEFVTKRIITVDRIESFKENYKNRDKYLCLFTLSELGAQFIFLPIE